MSVWSCPLCREPLLVSQKCLSCENGHSFDRARQGHVNLLLANQKNSRNPGDNESMVMARREFLRAGYYQPLVEALCHQLATLNHTKNSDINVLDLGCGEGFYLERLVSALYGTAWLTNTQVDGGLYCWGVDVSKLAVRKAMSSAKTGVLTSINTSGRPARVHFDYAVASNYRLPVRDNCIDIALNIFAPVSPEEVQRVLSPGGIFVRVLPAKRHLYQLKALLYEQVRLHESPVIETGWKLMDKSEVNFPVRLTSSQGIEQLLGMTPLSWHGKREAKQALIAKGRLELEACFEIQLLTSL